MREGNTTITEEEKSRPYAKFLEWESGPYDDEAYQHYIANTRIDPAVAMTIERVSDLLEPGYLPDEYGCCTMPDETGYVACKIRMPDIEPQMLSWFIAWTNFEDLRYKIWWPQTHYTVAMEPETRRRLLDLTMTPAEALYGTKRFISEDMGTGTVDIELRYMSPQELGFDLNRFHEPNVAAWSLTNSRATKGAGYTMILCHFMRRHPDGGCELRTRNWFGWRMVDGKLEKTIPAGEAIPESVLRGFWLHYIQEFSRFRDLAPLLYREYAKYPMNYGIDFEF